MSLTKRNSIWYTRLLVGGKWKTKSTKCRDRRAAERVHAMRERASADPTHFAADTATLGSMIAAFLAAAKRTDRADGTQRMYDQKGRHLARVIGQTTKAAHVDARAVDAFCDTRLKEGASRNTIAKELITLRGILRLARRSGLYPHELDKVLPKWDAAYMPRETYLTPEQLNRLLCALPPNRRHYVRFAVATAGRHSELMAARPGDVDDARGVVFVRSTKTKKKGQGDRHVPITPLTSLLLAGVQLPLERWEDGSRTRDLAAACKRAGVPRVTANDLRRTHATWLVQAGVNDDTAGRAMGHASAEMVKRIYGRMSPEALAANVNAQIARGPVTQIGTHLGHENADQRGSTGTNWKRESAKCAGIFEFCGRGWGARTHDLRIWNPLANAVFCEELPLFLMQWDTFGTCRGSETPLQEKPGDRAAAKLVAWARELSAGRLAWDAADGFALAIGDGGEDQ